MHSHVWTRGCEPSQEGPVRLVADRARPRAPRPGHRRRAASAPTRPRDRLARPGPGDRGAAGGEARRFTRPATGSPPSPAHIASEACGHDLHCFQALRSMDEILVANFMLFQEVVEDGLYDLVVGDEAWDVDHFWHENPELKRGSHVWLTDFVGYLPMPDGGDHEAFLTADYNAEMIDHIANLPAHPRPVDLRRQPRRRRPRHVRSRPAQDPRLDRVALRLLRLHHRLLTARPPTRSRQWRAELGYRDDELDLRRHRRRIRRRPRPARDGDRRPPDRSQRTVPGAAHDRRRRPAHRPRQPAAAPRASRSTATSTGSTDTSPCATSPSCRVGSRRRWSSPRPSDRSSTSRSPTTSSRTSTCATASTSTAPAMCMDFATTDPDASRRRDRPHHRPHGRLPRRRDRRRPTRGRDDRRADLGGFDSYWWLNRACASRSRSRYGSPLTSTATRWMVPPVNRQGWLPA